MNSLNLNESGLIGSEVAIENLKNMKNISALVISDSHGEYDIFCKVIDEFAVNVDLMIFCGDGLCDFFRYFEEAKVNVKMQEKLPPVIAVVRGNCDIEDFSFVKDMLVFEAAGRNILVTHGHRFSVNFGTDTLSASAASFDADFAFYGHTHIVHWEEVSGILLLNPGSCSLPRGSKYKSFAVINFPGLVERYSFQYFCVEKNIFGKVSFSPINF